MLPPPGLDNNTETVAIGPPPGIDDPKKIHKKKKQSQTFPQPSLESLKLELKVTVQDQQFDQIPLSEEYNEPSVNNLIAYNGFLCDTCGSDSLAIWDTNMKLVKECKGLAENMRNQCPFVAVYDKIYMSFADIMYMMEPQHNRKSELFSQYLQAFCVSDHTNPRIIGVSDGILHLWIVFNSGKPGQLEPQYNNFPIKTKKAELQRTLTEKFEECDDLLMLPMGQIFAKHKKIGRVYQIDFENDEMDELQITLGCVVTCWCVVSYDTFAFASGGQIVLQKFTGFTTTVLLTIINPNKEDIYHGLCFAGNQLFAINLRAQISSWKLESNQKNKSTFVKFCPGLYQLTTINQNVIMAEDKEKKDFVLLSTNLDKLFTYKARVKQILNCCSSPDGQFIAIVVNSGVQHDEELIFHLEIEIYPFDSKLNFQRRKDVENIETKAVTFLNNSTIQYIIKTVKSINPTLVQWNFIENQITETEMRVEKYKACQLYPLRSIFSFEFKPPSQFNLFAPRKQEELVQFYIGLSVYDENINRLFKTPAESQLTIDIFGMPNENLLYALNNKNQIEVWDVMNKLQIQKADCRPSIIKQIRLSNNYIFLNAQSEWIIRDLKLGQKCKTKGDLIKKCLFLDQKCVVLQGTKLLLWNIETNQCQQQVLPFAVSDFCIANSKIIVIGDSTIKMLTI